MLFRSHGDLSLENLMWLPKQQKIVVIDFGLAVKKPTEQQIHPGFSKPRGKLNYIAPELMRKDTPFEVFKIDLWSLGVVLYTLAYNQLPYNTPTTTDAIFYRLWTQGVTSILPPRRLKRSQPFIHFLSLLLQPANKRASLDSLFQAPWLAHLQSGDQ